jgi:hypothetical protein
LHALPCTFNTITGHEHDGAKEKVRRVVTKHELSTCWKFYICVMGRHEMRLLRRIFEHVGEEVQRDG